MNMEAIRRDERLHSFAIDELDRDPNVISAHVGVVVTDDLVTLFGTACHDRDRLAPVDAARRVEGVRVIVDAISVGDNNTDLAADNAIGTRLVQILDSAPALPFPFTLLVRNRVVTMAGVVDTAFDRQTIRRLAGHPPGVRWVRDNLVIRPVTCSESDSRPVDSSADPPTLAETPASNTSRSLARSGPRS